MHNRVKSTVILETLPLTILPTSGFYQNGEPSRRFATVTDGMVKNLHISTPDSKNCWNALIKIPVFIAVLTLLLSLCRQKDLLLDARKSENLTTMVPCIELNKYLLESSEVEGGCHVESQWSTSCSAALEWLVCEQHTRMSVGGALLFRQMEASYNFTASAPRPTARSDHSMQYSYGISCNIKGLLNF